MAATPFTSAACTGSAQTAIIPNMGQSMHFLTVTTSGVIAFRATVQGSHDSVTFNDISDSATTSGNTVQGNGYYPVVQISITCATASGTFTAKYSGEATAPGGQLGAQASGQTDKTLASGVAAGSNFTSQSVRAPFANTAGAIYFLYSNAGPAGSTLNVNCSTLAVGTGTNVANFPLSTSATPQFFPVPGLPCDFVTVTYNAGGASAQTFSMSYVFNSAPVTGGDPCQSSTAPKTGIVINASANTKLGAGLTNHSFYICGFNFTLASGAGATGAQFQSGTGTNCGTGTVNLTGVMAGITSSTIAIDSGGGGYTVFKTAAGVDFCISVGGTGPSAQGVVTVIQQ